MYNFVSPKVHNEEEQIFKCLEIFILYIYSFFMSIQMESVNTEKFLKWILNI